MDPREAAAGDSPKRKSEKLLKATDVRTVIDSMHNNTSNSSGGARLLI
jgi:hypothetical protein